MNKRIDLHYKLEALLGSKNVYFQPPATIKLKYPCIIYKRSSVDTIYADNEPYRHHKGYTITVIDKNPDSDIPGKIAKLPLCRFERSFTQDNLNHDIYKVY